MVKWLLFITKLTTERVDYDTPSYFEDTYYGIEKHLQESFESRFYTTWWAHVAIFLMFTEHVYRHIYIFF